MKKHNYKITIIYDSPDGQHIFTRTFPADNVREAIEVGLQSLRDNDDRVMARGLQFAPRRLSALRVRA